MKVIPFYSILILLIGVSTGYSQVLKSYDYKISWSEVKENKVGETAIGTYFEPDFGGWNDLLRLPVVKFSRTTSNVNNELIVDYVETINLTDEELKSIDKNNVVDFFDWKIKNVRHNGNNIVIVESNGVRYNSLTNTYEKLARFKVSLVPVKSTDTPLKSYVNSSVLSEGTGNWYKIGVTESGVYKLTYEMLVNLGWSGGMLYSDQLNLYGNSFGQLPENNSSYRPDDLIKNAIKVVDGNDGLFQSGDYVLFYANGPDVWKYTNGSFARTHHEYCDTSYLFLNVGNASPLRIGLLNESNLSAAITVSNFTHLTYLEEEKYNLLSSGREWFGNKFDVQTSYSYNFQAPNLTGDTAKITVKFVGKSYGTTSSMDIATAGFTKNINIASVGTGAYPPAAVKATGLLSVPLTGNSFSVNITYNKGGIPSALGYLDYIEVVSRRKLKMDESQMIFRDEKSVGIGNVVEYQLQNGNNVVEIWDVTNPNLPKNCTMGWNGSNRSLIAGADSLRTFVALNGVSYKSPSLFGKVGNQNLHGLGYADEIIITTAQLREQANELAQFHRGNGYSIHVVTDREVYNEFSSGMTDPTAIKHFLRMFYKKANGNNTEVPKYCLIFADATFDTRNIQDHNLSFVPTYESKESLSSTYTFATDDYFGIVADGMAIGNSDIIDIAIGRIPVKNEEEAKGVVSKIISYSTPTSGGKAYGCSGGGSDCNTLEDWRNLVMLISDDGDANAYFSDVEVMAGKIDASRKSMNIIKVHSDAYAQVSTPGGERNYGAEELVKQQVERGALLVNYIGHGGEVGWAHERILTVPTIQNWTNGCQNPVFMTATCEFSRYDDHDRTSAGEYVLLNPNGGGIALFTTTRLVFASSNEKLNRFFYDTIFDVIGGNAQSLGAISKGMKNKYAMSGADVGFRKFALLGDPLVNFALPVNEVITDSLNGVEITGSIDTLKALSTVVLKGHVEDANGNVMNNFNGIVYPTIYDKPIVLSTLGSESGTTPMNFSTRKNIVYRGKATVTNGYFTYTFIVPRDIAFNYGNTRLSYYVENGSLDGQGYSEVPLIGGIDTTAVPDTEGPEIKLYLNDNSFVSGGTSDENPRIYAEVYDESGINTVGNGIGHNIEAILDDESSSAITLNDYYQADLDTYKSGKITYPLSGLEQGEHKLSIRVWDVHNNSNRSEISFVVAENAEIALSHVLNYPNPFTTRTEFFFEHNQICDYLDVQIQIFTVSGQIIKTITERIHTDGYRIGGLKWDGRDEFGDEIATGVYVYKLKVVNEAGKALEKIEKLVVLH